MANVRKIFFEAMDVPSGSRASFLDRACGGDVGLRAEVESLLAGLDEVGDFMDVPLVNLEDTEDAGPDRTLPGAPVTSSGARPGALPAVPGYDILSELGRGGMGVVYKARQVAAGRAVALKTVRPGQDAADRDRFLREAESAAGLRHPNVVEIFDVGEADGGPYFSMEYCPAGNLDEYLGGRPLDGRDAARVAAALARAVDAGHESGLLHRDIKPANVMLAGPEATGPVGPGERRPVSEYTPKLTDFGLAKRAGDEKLTQTGVLMGTPSYMSPEQASGGDVGPASDVYALGAVLYECLTGRPPFVAATPLLTVAMVLEQEAVPPRRLQPGLARDLETVCLKCLRKEPSRRYAGAGELADDLVRFVEGRPISARPAGPAERSYKWVRRNKAVAGSTAAVVLSLALGVVFSVKYAIKAEEQRDSAALERDLKDDALREKSAALQAESEQRQLAEAVRDLLLSDLIGQGDASIQMSRIRAGGQQSEFVQDPKVSELLKRAAMSLTEPKLAERFPDRPLVQAEFLRFVGRVFWSVGEYSQSAGHLERAERRFTKHAGDAHLDTLICRGQLALAYLDGGRLDEAIPLLERTLGLCEQKLGEGDPSVAACRNNLALAYKSAGRSKEALPLLEHVLGSCERGLGPDHPDTLICRNNLALAYSEAGRLGDAIPLFKRVLESGEQTLGPDHPDIFASRNNLALAYQRMGQLKKAIPLFEGALKSSERTEGSDHPSTLICRNNLAMTYVASGSPKRAIPLLKELVARFEQALGEDHPNTLQCRQNLAGAFLEAGRFKEAIPRFERVLKSREQTLGKDHPNTIDVRSNLAYTYEKVGRLDDTLRMFEEVLASRKRVLGEDHPDTLTSNNNLAFAYMKAGRLKDAIPLYEVAYLGAKKRQFRHENALSFLSNLSDAYGRAGLLAKQEAVLRDQIVVVKTKVPAGHRAISSAQIGLVRCLFRREQYAEAETLARSSWRIRRSQIPDLWLTAEAEAVYGEALLGREKYAEAGPHLTAGYAALKQAFAAAKSPSPQLVRSLRTAVGALVRLAEATEKPDDAKRWRAELANLPNDGD